MAACRNSKKKNIISAHEPIYGSTIEVLITDNEDQAGDFLGFTPDELADAYTQYFDDMHWKIWLRDFTISNLAHEVYHVTECVKKRIQPTTEYLYVEPMAYYIGWLAQAIYDQAIEA